MAGPPGSKNLGQHRTDEPPDGPWNQPEIQAARARQSRITIGELPARAAPIGKPFVRGNRKLQAVLITPETDGDRTGLRRAADERAAARRSRPAQPPETAEASDDRDAFDDRDAGLAVLETRPVTAPTPPTTHSRRWPLIATGVAFLCSVAIPVALHASASSSPRTPARPTAAVLPAKTVAPAVQLRTQALAWIRANLPKTAVIVTDAASAASLRSSGFTGAEVFGQVIDVPVQTIDYVMNVPGISVLRTGPSGSAALISSSLPLASFVTGGAGATVREYFPTGIADLVARRAHDDALRKQGGSELASNPGLVFDRAGQALVAAGGLDLRAQNVLNVLASAGTTYATVGAPITAETRAGQPVRTVTVTTTDPSALQAALVAMVAPYQPDNITAISDRKYRLTWNPAIAPLLTVG